VSVSCLKDGFSIDLGDQHVALTNLTAHMSDSKTTELGNKTTQTCPYYSLDLLTYSKQLN